MNETSFEKWFKKYNLELSHQDKVAVAESAWRACKNSMLNILERDRHSLSFYDSEGRCLPEEQLRQIKEEIEKL